MSKIKLVVHECYAGKQKSEEFFAAAIVNCCCIDCMMKGWFCPNTVTTKNTPERISLSGVMQNWRQYVYTGTGLVAKSGRLSYD